MVEFYRDARSVNCGGGNGDIFEGRSCCSHRVSESIDLHLGWMPSRANRSSSPVQSSAAGKVCWVPFQSDDRNACSKNQRRTTADARQILHRNSVFLAKTEDLWKGHKSFTAFLTVLFWNWPISLPNNFWVIFFHVYLCTPIPVKNLPVP